MIGLVLSIVAAQVPGVPLGGGVEQVQVVGEEPVPAKRFVDEPAATRQVEPGASGQVLYREAGWVRLRIADRYLWVREAAVEPVTTE